MRNNQMPNKMFEFNYELKFSMQNRKNEQDMWNGKSFEAQCDGLTSIIWVFYSLLDRLRFGCGLLPWNETISED